MLNSILDAIREGQWDFEPEQRAPQQFRATGAMPGSKNKLHIMAERVRLGMPLWHPSDRTDYDQKHDDYKK